MTKPRRDLDRRKIARRFPAPRRQSALVNKLCIFVGAALGGYTGWGLGDGLGMGVGWAFVLSGVGSMAGVYAGWKLARKLAE
ncbi:MAG: hypothetical protein RIQ93_705 [Verrucomicrobiota bacterium]|jgi:uncharacterized protein YcfJ